MNIIQKYLQIIITMVLPLILICFSILDISVFRIFNLDLGYLILLVNNISISTTNIILIIILIPILFMILFIIGSLSSVLATILFFDKLKLQKQKSAKTTFGLLLISYVFFLIISTNLFSYSYIEYQFSNTLFFVILFGITIILNTLYCLVYKLSETKMEFMVIVFLALCIVSFLSTFLSKIPNYESLSNSIVFIFILSIMLHSFTTGLIPSSKKVITKEYNLDHGFITGLNFNKSENNKKQFFLNKLSVTAQNITAVSIWYVLIALGMIYFDSVINSSSWKRPIDVTKTYDIPNLSMNLIFNRGLLINSNSKVPVVISNYYLNKINKENDLFLKCKKLDVGSNSKYLQFGDNIKIYFKNDYNDIDFTTKVFVFLVEEKKFSNKNGSEYTLIALSSFDIPSID